MKSCWGSRIIAASILKLSSGWTRMVNFTPGCFTVREGPQYPLNRRLDGPLLVWTLIHTTGTE